MDRKGAVLTYTTREDSIIFLGLDCFGTDPEATCPAYKELSTLNTRSAVEEKEHAQDFQDF